MPFIERMINMQTINIIIKIVALIIVTLGVIMIYDARKLSKKWFSFGDRNDSTKIFKIGNFFSFSLDFFYGI